MAPTGQPSLASAAEANADSGTSPSMATATSPWMLNTSGHVDSQRPQPMQPSFTFVVPVEVTALTDCVVWHINREAFFDFMQQEPTVLRAFLEILSERGHFLSRKMRTFAVNSLRNRVIEYLEANGSITSVAAAAEQLGATRPSLSRVLSEMVSEGLITKDGKGYKKC